MSRVRHSLDPRGSSNPSLIPVGHDNPDPSKLVISTSHADQHSSDKELFPSVQTTCVHTCKRCKKIHQLKSSEMQCLPCSIPNANLVVVFHSGLVQKTPQNANKENHCVCACAFTCVHMHLCLWSFLTETWLETQSTTHLCSLVLRLVIVAGGWTTGTQVSRTPTSAYELQTFPMWDELSWMFVYFL